jgi:hypothetical protein
MIIKIAEDPVDKEQVRLRHALPIHMVAGSPSRNWNDRKFSSSKPHDKFRSALEKRSDFLENLLNLEKIPWRFFFETFRTGDDNYMRVLKVI